MTSARSTASAKIFAPASNRTTARANVRNKVLHGVRAVVVQRVLGCLGNQGTSAITQPTRGASRPSRPLGEHEVPDRGERAAAQGEPAKPERSTASALAQIGVAAVGAFRSGPSHCSGA